MTTIGVTCDGDLHAWSFPYDREKRGKVEFLRDCLDCGVEEKVRL